MNPIEFSIHVPCKCKCGCENSCSFGQFFCSFCRQGFHNDRSSATRTSEQKESK